MGNQLALICLDCEKAADRLNDQPFNLIIQMYNPLMFISLPESLDFPREIKKTAVTI